MSKYKEELIKILSELDIAGASDSNLTLLQELNTDDIDVLYKLYREKAPIIEDSLTSLETESEDLVVELLVGIQRAGAESIGREYQTKCFNNLIEELMRQYCLNRNATQRILEFLEDNESRYPGIPFSKRFALIADYLLFELEQY